MPLVASLDLHCVLTAEMIEAADLLVPYHTYPHVDQCKRSCSPAGGHESAAATEGHGAV